MAKIIDKEKEMIKTSKIFFEQLWIKTLRWLFGLAFLWTAFDSYKLLTPRSLFYFSLSIIFIPPTWKIVGPQLQRLWQIISAIPFAQILKPITKPISTISPNLLFIGLIDRSKNLQLLKSDEQDLREYLASLGFEKSEISESQFNVTTVYKEKESGYGTTNIIENYNSTINFYVTTNKVANVSQGINKLRLFVEERGLDLSENAAEFTYTSFEAEKIPLLEKAVEDAQLRANALVSSTTGVSKTTIGKVLSAQQGIFQVNSANDTSVSDWGNFDLSSIEKTIRATVKVEFATD